MVVGKSDAPTQGILERLEAGEVILGDGSYVNTLEKRGYVKVGVNITKQIQYICLFARRATTHQRAAWNTLRPLNNWLESEKV